MQIIPFSENHRAAIIYLWQQCELTRPWNDPNKDIDRKLAEHPELFLIGIEDNQVIASVMGGYEGHRGWVSYLAVAPDRQHKGYGKEIMRALEEKLLQLGCPKINLQVRTTNTKVIAFYEAMGFKMDDVVSMGKRLINDD